jgi:transposase-like protein
MESAFPGNLVEFAVRFVTDEACASYLAEVRWPDGFVCPACGGRKNWTTSRKTYFCGSCRHQTSLTAGTIFHRSHLPLRSWFWAMWLMCTQKTGLSAKGLERELGLGSYQTAWLMLQKLRQAMVRVGRDMLSGTVEVDETYLGGEESGVHGRQLVGKALVAIGVELAGKKIGRIRLRHIPDASGQSLVGFISDSVVKGTKVHTDDWNGYNLVQEAGYRHQVTPILGDPERALKSFPHVHLVASLLKRWLGATHQGKVSGKHLQRYLDEYAFRFNRRHSEHVGKLFHRLAEQLVLRQAETYPEITRAK